MQNTEFHDDIFMRICDYPCSFPSPTPPAPSSLVTFLHHLQTFLQCHVLCLVIFLVPEVCCLGSRLHRASFPSRLVMLQTDRERCLRGGFCTGSLLPASQLRQKELQMECACISCPATCVESCREVPRYSQPQWVLIFQF